MFEIWKNGVLIGHSKLEHGDPPMGVAHGVFLPTDNFSLLDAEAEFLDEDSRRWENGLALQGKSGKTIDCSAGIVIIEYDFPEQCKVTEISCLGIGYPLYEELFPQHVKTYNEQFGD